MDQRNFSDFQESNTEEDKKKDLLSRIANPRILFMGMPGASNNHYEMNVAQAPQGPEVKKGLPLPGVIGRYLNEKLKLVFNPSRETPYAGIALIKQNLANDFPEVEVDIQDFPNPKTIVDEIDEKYYPLIGFSIGCENRVPQAEDLAREIQARYMLWADKILMAIDRSDAVDARMSVKRALLAEMTGKLLKTVDKIPGGKMVKGLTKAKAVDQLVERFGEELKDEILKDPALLYYLVPTIISGNYGGTTAKKVHGDKTPLNQRGRAKTEILWDNKMEREEKRARGVEPYSGEGVHDTRVFLKKMGFNLKADHNDPIVSEAIMEQDLVFKNPAEKWVLQKIGFGAEDNGRMYISCAIGCTNTCHFCNTSAQFEGRKEQLINNTTDLFQAMLKAVKEQKAKNPDAIDFNFWVQDENFSKTEHAITELCTLIEKSGEDIHWGISTDIAGLIKYKEKHGSFRGLMRGGLSQIWLGIESKADFFDKRNGATPEDVEELVKEIQGLGITIIGSFIVGLPIHTEGETYINEDGIHEKMDIHEDLAWARSLNTVCNQIMMFTYTDLVKNRSTFKPVKIKTRKNGKALGEGPVTKQQVGDKGALLGVRDDEFGHLAVSNMSQIESNDRLEELDRMARQLFFDENGPVALRLVIMKWNAYKNLINSENETDQRAAYYAYWLVKKNLHLLSLSTLLLSDTLFEQCSDKFLQELATVMGEAARTDIADTPYNEKYRKDAEKYDSKVAGVAKVAGELMRKRFVKRVLGNKK